MRRGFWPWSGRKCKCWLLHFWLWLCTSRKINMSRNWWTFWKILPSGRIMPPIFTTRMQMSHSGQLYLSNLSTASSLPVTLMFGQNSFWDLGLKSCIRATTYKSVISSKSRVSLEKMPGAGCERSCHCDVFSCTLNGNQGCWRPVCCCDSCDKKGHKEGTIPYHFPCPWPCKLMIVSSLLSPDSNQHKKDDVIVFSWSL